MKGPIRIARSDWIKNLYNTGSLYSWFEGESSSLYTLSPMVTSKLWAICRAKVFTRKNFKNRS